MTRYHDRRLEGYYNSPTEAEPEEEPADTNDAAMPRTHAGLDELAAERNHSWSSDDLTVAEKQWELTEASE